MTINTRSFAKALLPGIHKWVGMEYKDYMPQYAKVFEKFTSTKAFEEEVGVTGFGYAVVKTEGGGVTFDDMEQGFVQRYTAYVMALGFKITREMFEDNQYMSLGLRKTKGLTFAMKQTKEVLFANILNRAFNSDYTYADGVEMCSALHPNKSGGTWRNELETAADLSEDSLEQACIDIGAFESDRGMLIKVSPKQLIIPPALEFDAARILKSVQQSGTANNDINALKTLSKIPNLLVYNYLTDSDAWFIQTDCPDGLKYFQRRAQEVETDNDFDTQNASYLITERFVPGATDMRGIFGSPGA
jgi:hypothetical protein